MDPANLKKLNAARRERRAAILLTEMESGRDRVIGEQDAVAGALGEITAAAFRSGKSGIHAVDGREYFLNVHVPAPRIAAAISCATGTRSARSCAMCWAR